MVCECEFDVIALTETCLHDDVRSAELFPAEYEVHRKDRNFNLINKSRGGGVLLAIESCLKSQILDPSAIDISFPMIDFLLVRVQLSYKIVYFSIVYIPDKLSTVDFEYFCEYLCMIEYFDKGDSVYFMGDFNAPNFTEDNISDCKSMSLLSFMNSCNFGQYNVDNNANHRTLDLVFARSDCIICREDFSFVQEDVHHPALNNVLPNIFTKVRTFVSNNSGKVYNFKKGNYQLLFSDLSSVDWSFLDTCVDVNLAVERFYMKFHELLDKHVPTYKSFSHKYPSWFGSDIIRNVKTKAKLRTKCEKFRRESDIVEFRRLR